MQNIEAINKSFIESPVSVKMRIRHYFSQLSLHSAASYDLNQDSLKSRTGQFDKEESELIDSQVGFLPNYLVWQYRKSKLAYVIIW